MWDDLTGKQELHLFLTFEEYVSVDKEEETMEIIDNTVIVESVSSPLEEDDEPEPEHVSIEEALRCVKKLKIYIGKMENIYHRPDVGGSTYL
jgi:hypothetical protein